MDKHLYLQHNQNRQTAASLPQPTVVQNSTTLENEISVSCFKCIPDSQFQKNFNTVLAQSTRDAKCSFIARQVEIQQANPQEPHKPTQPVGSRSTQETGRANQPTNQRINWKNEKAKNGKGESEMRHRRWPWRSRTLRRRRPSTRRRPPPGAA
jgi:hypothetical protein